MSNLAIQPGSRGARRYHSKKRKRCHGLNASLRFIGAETVAYIYQIDGPSLEVKLKLSQTHT